MIDWGILASVVASILVAVVGFLANWIHKVQGSTQQNSVDIGNLRAHVAENYVQNPHITRLAEDVSQMRQDLAGALALLHELKGQFQNRG